MAYKVKKFGDYRERRSFSRTKNVLELNDLLEIQKKSYQQFLEVGIKEIFDENHIEIPYPKMMVYERDTTKNKEEEK